MCVGDLNTYAESTANLTVDVESMTWQLAFESSLALDTTDLVVELLLTVQLENRRWLDNFDVVTLADAQQNVDSPCTDQPRAFSLFKVRAPSLCVTESIVFVNNPTFTSDAGTIATNSFGFANQAADASVAPFSATIGESATGVFHEPVIAQPAAPIVTEAGDRLRHAVTIGNGGFGSAFAVALQLASPTAIFGEPQLVGVYLGNGTALLPTDYSLDASTRVLSIDAELGGSDAARSGTFDDGTNVWVVVLETPVLDAFEFTSVAVDAPSPVQLLRYQARDGAGQDNFVDLHNEGVLELACLRNVAPTASLQPQQPSQKALVVRSSDACSVSESGSLNSREVAVGEQMCFEHTLELAGGTTNSVRFVATLASELAVFESATVLALPGGASSNANSVTVGAASVTPAQLVAVGASLTLFDFGDIFVDPATSSDAERRVTVEHCWRVREIAAETFTPAASSASRFRVNSAYLVDNGAGTLSISTTSGADVVRNSLQIAPDSSALPAAPAEGDDVELCFVLSALFLSEACIYDVAALVEVPANLQLVPGSAAVLLESSRLPFAGTGVSLAQNADNVLLTIDTFDKSQEALRLCANATIIDAQIGGEIVTNATACSATQPSTALSGVPFESDVSSVNCFSDTLTILPEIFAVVDGTVTSDSCTQNGLVRVGEQVEVTQSFSLDADVSDLQVSLDWSSIPTQC